jgi:hypothetical protein
MSEAGLFGMAIVSIISLLITAFITRMIFSIPLFLRKQDAIIKLLAEIALKNGTDATRVADIVKGPKFMDR